MDTYFTLFITVGSLVAIAINLAVGMSIQRHIDAKRIRALELQRNDAHEEMVQQEWCCERLPELEARVRELEAQLVEIYRDDDDDYDYEWDYVEDEAVLNWSHQ